MVLPYSSNLKANITMLDEGVLILHLSKVKLPAQFCYFADRMPAELLKIHPINPEGRKIAKAIQVLRDGGISYRYHLWHWM